ncbi:hypothetical protein BB560_005421 [Smittium megazygosporum]|uniref:Uncharacterized protein n=1 Tax=Smittium megazygosporum TaxID=133381 RepID=A0A2T9Z5Z2_9FUNG|nr:hypothetical protein BB560_005421 [Smittium megazygosporum]
MSYFKRKEITKKRRLGQGSKASTSFSSRRSPKSSRNSFISSDNNGSLSSGFNFRDYSASSADSQQHSHEEGPTNTRFDISGSLHDTALNARRHKTRLLKLNMSPNDVAYASFSDNPSLSTFSNSESDMHGDFIGYYLHK